MIEDRRIPEQERTRGPHQTRSHSLYSEYGEKDLLAHDFASSQCPISPQPPRDRPDQSRRRRVLPRHFFPLGCPRFAAAPLAAKTWEKDLLAHDFASSRCPISPQPPRDRPDQSRRRRVLPRHFFPLGCPRFAAAPLAAKTWEKDLLAHDFASSRCPISPQPPRDRPDQSRRRRVLLRPRELPRPYSPSSGRRPRGAAASRHSPAKPSTARAGRPPARA